MNKMMTITQIAKRLEISPGTIIKWEKRGLIRKAKRNPKGWRVYDQNDAEKLKAFYLFMRFETGIGNRAYSNCVHY